MTPRSGRMVFQETELSGAYIIESDPIRDQRGFFVRTFCQEEFEQQKLVPPVSQCSLSYNLKKGTLRGMHYQERPHAEAKLVTCVSGVMYDVIVDLRPSSATYLRWFGVELAGAPATASEQASLRSLYVPAGFAHGFQTLTNDVAVYYQISTPYRPEYARGVRWDDPALGIRWPEDDRIISERDRTFPNFAP